MPRHTPWGRILQAFQVIPPMPGTSTETNPDTMGTQKIIQDSEWMVPSTLEEPTITQELGTYPAIPVQQYQDGPIEKVAVSYVRITRVFEKKAIRNRQQEDNIQSAEYFMFDLETLIKETATDPDVIEVQWCLEDNNTLANPEDYEHVAKKLTHRCWGITMVDDRIIVPKNLGYAALNALYFGHPTINKLCSDATIFWRPNMRADIEKKAKTCSTLPKCR